MTRFTKSIGRVDVLAVALFDSLFSAVADVDLRGVLGLLGFVVVDLTAIYEIIFSGRT